MKTTSKKDIREWRSAALAGALMASLTACVPNAPRLDTAMGMAVNTARAQQTANPDASRNDPVKGIDGQAGDAAVDNYRESFVNPRPARTGGVVDVGTGRGGSGGGGGFGMGGR